MLKKLGILIAKTTNRVLRGGSWNNSATNCRVANRNYNSPGNSNSNNGFRVVFSKLKKRGGYPLLNRLFIPDLFTTRQILITISVDLVIDIMKNQRFLNPKNN